VSGTFASPITEQPVLKRPTRLGKIWAASRKVPAPVESFVLLSITRIIEEECQLNASVSELGEIESERKVVEVSGMLKSYTH
jgi:hypothetical protein